MKITAGLGSIDDYIAFAQAGADELFCGYVPAWWTKKYGIHASLNRREVFYYNVQIGSISEMEILHDMICHYQVPVTITLNALSYLPSQYPDLLIYVEECLSLGFSSFIIADLSLLFFLSHSQYSDRIQLHISGELGEMNEHTISLFGDTAVNRIIFHRKMTIHDMKKCIYSNRALDYEAFLLNENCHFHGGFCNSLHCDELCHICHLPFHNAPAADSLTNILSVNSISNDISELIDSYLPGITGCGLCSLWDLREAGITYLKIVGRGNYTEDMILDIQACHKALSLLSKAPTKEAFITCMKHNLFPGGCSNNCYYRDTLI